MVRTVDGCSSRYANWPFQLISQHVNHSANLSIREQIIHSMNQSISEWIDLFMYQERNKRKWKGWIDECLIHTINLLINWSIAQSASQSINQSITHSIIQSFSHSTNQAINQSSCHWIHWSTTQSFCQSINQLIIQSINQSMLNRLLSVVIKAIKRIHQDYFHVFWLSLSAVL